LVVTGFAALVLTVVACGPPAGTTADAASVRRGGEIYVFEGCGSCHGADCRGSKSAPTLERLHRHWSAGELAAYLHAPRGYPKDRRLRTVSERFPAEMAGLPAASAERVHDLVAFLLSR